MPASDAILDELLKAIYANPSSDAARLAYADALGDESPHAKLIRAQVARGSRRPSVEEAAAEAELLADDPEHWHGAPPRHGETFVRFERGFLSATSIALDVLVSCADQPSWGTVQRLWVYDCDSVPWEILRRPTLSAVRSLFVSASTAGDRSIGEARKVAIARELLETDLPFSELALSLPATGSELSTEARDLLEHVRRPATLRSLGFVYRRTRVRSLRWLWNAPLASGLERVFADDGIGSIPAWIEESPHLPSSVTSVELSFRHGWQGSVASVTRDDAGAFSRVAIDLAHHGDKHFAKEKVEDMIKLLDALPSDALTRFTLDVRGMRVTKSVAAQLERAALRQVRLEQLQLPMLGVVDASRRATVAVQAPGMIAAAAASAARSARVDALKTWAADAAGLTAEERAAFGELHLGELARIEAATEVVRKRERDGADDAFGEACLRLIELPTASSLGLVPATNEAALYLSHATNRLCRACFGALEHVRPRGIAKRLLGVLDRDDGQHWEVLDCYGREDGGPRRGVIPPEELPMLLDWYESCPLSGRFGYRRISVFEATRAYVLSTGDESTVRNLEERLADSKRKLSTFRREFYEGLVRDLRGQLSAADDG